MGGCLAFPVCDDRDDDRAVVTALLTVADAARGSGAGGAGCEGGCSSPRLDHR